MSLRKMIPDLCSRVSFFPKLNSELYGAEKYEILGIDYAESSYISELPGFLGVVDGAIARIEAVLLAAGVLLMMLPMGPSGGSEEAQGPPEGEGPFDLELFEEKLSQVLSDIQGAGKTRVVLTLKSGSRQILAQNVERDGERSSASAVTTSGR